MPMLVRIWRWLWFVLTGSARRRSHCGQFFFVSGTLKGYSWQPDMEAGVVQKSTTFREPTESEHATAVDLYATRVDFIASRLLDRFAVLDKVSSVKIAAYIMSVVAEILIEEAKIRTVEEARHPGAK